MLIGADDIGNDVITLGTCFSMFVFLRARFPLALIGGNLTAQATGNHRRIEGGIQMLETYCKLSPSFSRPSARAYEKGYHLST